MSKKSASRLSARLTKSVSILALGVSLSGCSSGTVRFSDGFYTGALPKENAVASSQSAYPSTGANQPYQAPVTAPEYTPTDYGNVVGQNVDDVYTGSVRSTSAVRREVLSAPQTPYPTRNVATPPAPVAAVPAKPKLAPLTSASAPVVKPVNTLAAPAPKSGIDPMTTASVQTAAPVVAKRTEGWTAAGGTYVTMREGETVYNLAKRYGVPANAIMEANNISDPKSISAGKQVIIPTYVYSRTAPNSMPDNNIAVRSASSNIGGRTDIPLSQAPYPSMRPANGTRSVAVAAPNVAPSAPTSTTSSGKYVVASGDTLTRVASRTGASVAAIRRLNGMTTDNIRIGQTLLIPGVAGNPTAENLAAAKTTDPVNTSSASAQTAPKASGAISTIDASSTAKAPSDTGVASLRWPAKGRIVSAFGSNSGGKANDGIDISLPEGTSIKSAENGVVIYAGDGLKEFGKTVLIRHGNGLVTVYGNLQTINVKQGATVNRGQSLGLSGMSGNARQPQLHFEVRKDTSPVNPLKYLG